MKKLGFGAMRLPLSDGKDPSSIDTGKFIEMADYYLSHGFNYFDTAYPYHGGMSETALKKAVVDRYLRESFILADKMPVWMIKKNEEYREIFETQLKRCGVSYFDIYLLHALNENVYPSVVNSGGFEFMKKIKEEGSAKHIGFSFHDSAELLDRILTEHPEMEYVQLQINYIDWESEAIQSRLCYEVAIKHGKQVIVMEPVKGGALATVPQETGNLFKSYNPGMSAASWAIRYAASLDNVFVVLSGMSNFEQLADNVSYMENFVPLNNTEKEIIEKALKQMNNKTAIACTACRYCVDECPKKIPIPDFFSLYNDQKQFDAGITNFYYGQLTQKCGKARDCISCKICEKHCPQHLEISSLMKEVSKAFDK